MAKNTTANPDPAVAVHPHLNYGAIMMPFSHRTPADLPKNLSSLIASGYRARTVKAELIENLLSKLRKAELTLPGIVGFEETVGPAVERALLAGHDFVLLGERGQGKTRLIRSLINLLDEWSPHIAGCPINDEPTAPICSRCIALLQDQGEDIAIDWRHRSERYGEKLATPDTSVGDLIGDVDPIKVAEGRSLGDPETIHYGLIPRTHRGIFAINELPDLAERIQVALLNVLEERDIQVRGYSLRLPLDLLVVASANPEDYTNRGRIITPLKDRFGAEIRTHYPLDLKLEIQLLKQEAVIAAVVPHHILDVVARFATMVRSSDSVDQRSGVSARFSIACIEELSGAALRRSAINGDSEPVVRIGDLADVVPSLRGKVEFELAQEGVEIETLSLLARQATAASWRDLLGTQSTRAFLTNLVTWFDAGNTLATSDLMSGKEILLAIGPIEGLGALVAASESGLTESVGLVASCVEFATEGLWLTRRIDKDESNRTQRYTSSAVTELPE